RDIAQPSPGAVVRFVLVTTAHPPRTAAPRPFARERRAGGFPIAGIIANRVYEFPPLAATAGRQVPPRLREKLLANYADFAALSARDRAALAALQRDTGSALLATLPALEEPPTSIAGLRAIAAPLAGAEPESRSRPRGAQ